MDVEDVGTLAMRHAGVKRKGHEGHPKWYVDDRLVARPLDASAMVVRAGFAARERLLRDHPGTFSVPPRFEGHTMVVVELAYADPAAVERAVAEAVDLQRRR